MLTRTGIQFEASQPRCAQILPTLTGNAQPNCDPSEALPEPQALTLMDQNGDEDSDVQSWESGIFDQLVLQVR